MTKVTLCQMVSLRPLWVLFRCFIFSCCFTCKMFLAHSVLECAAACVSVALRTPCLQLHSRAAVLLQPSLPALWGRPSWPCALGAFRASTPELVSCVFGRRGSLVTHCRPSSSLHSEIPGVPSSLVTGLTAHMPS